MKTSGEMDALSVSIQEVKARLEMANVLCKKAVENADNNRKEFFKELDQERDL